MALSNSLVGRMTLLKAKLTNIPVRFGHPLYREMVIRTKTQEILPNGLVNNTLEDLYVNPIPKVKNVTWKMVGMELADNIYVGKNDYITEIVRTVDIPITYDDIEFIILDPKFDEQNRVIDGLKTKVIHISENDVLDWVLTLRLYKDSYTIEPQNSVAVTQLPGILTPVSSVPTATTIINTAVATAEYRHSGTMSNVNGRTGIQINGVSIGSYDDTGYLAWNDNKIRARGIGQTLEVQLQFRATTDTLGGLFNIEINKGGSDPILDTQDHTINTVTQDFTITSNIVVDDDFLNNGAEIFITPEVGMNLTINNLEILIITEKE